MPEKYICRMSILFFASVKNTRAEIRMFSKWQYRTSKIFFAEAYFFTFMRKYACSVKAA